MATGTTETEVLKHSVTRDETAQLRATNIFIPTGYQGYRFRLLPDVNYYPEGPQKDTILYSTLKSERTFWAGAVKTAIAQEAAMSWTVKSDVELRAKRGQDLLHTINGRRGWVEFVSRHLQDYLLTNNGVFIEIVRATASVSSRIIGLMHLSSFRCTRTGDPENPVIYTDMMGREHILKDYQVAFTADTPAGDLGYGMCAAETCYDKIRLLQAVEGSTFEKITGSQSQALDFVLGISDTTLRTALGAAESERNAENLAKGLIHYKGITTIPVMGEKIEHVRIPYAGLPENFERLSESEAAQLAFALALGLDPQDINPKLAPGGMNTSTQAAKLREAARGKGLATWEKWIEFIFNEYILPANTIFLFSERDYRDEQLRASISAARTGDVTAKIQAGILTPAQAVRILIEQSELPEWVLPDDEQDKIQNLVLEDTEKPLEETPASAENSETESEGATTDQPGATATAKTNLVNALASNTISNSKETSLAEIGKMIEQELTVASEIVAKARKSQAQTHSIAGAKTKEMVVSEVLAKFSQGKVKSVC